MLEKLDSIDWKALGSYPPGDPWNIPENVRRLLSDQPEVRQDALERLIDTGSHDTIWKATPHILPFLFELLGYESAPDKAAIIQQLEYVLEEVALMHSYSMVVMRRYVAIYDSFKERLPLLMRLLDADDEPVRLAVLNVLRHMHDDTPAIEAVLLDRLQEAHSETEALRMLQTLYRLWKPAIAWPGGPQRTLLPLLQNLIDGHESRRVRATAARLATFFPRELEWGNHALRETISALLAWEFFAQTTMFESEYPGPIHAQRVLTDIMRLRNAQDILLGLLRDPAISAEQAHLAGSALIASSYATSHLWHKNSYTYSATEQGFFYRPQADRSLFLPNHVKPVLARLIGIDAFWAVPTNLLSFHYGLPDDREELRALLDPQ